MSYQGNIDYWWGVLQKESAFLQTETDIQDRKTKLLHLRSVYGEATKNLSITDKGIKQDPRLLQIWLDLGIIRRYFFLKESSNIPVELDQNNRETTRKE